MMAFNSVFVLLSVCASLALGASFEFTSNFSSSTINSNGWKYAGISMDEINLGVWLGANYLSVDVEANNVTNTGTTDVVIGSAYVGLGGLPFSWLSYFDTNATLNLGTGQSFAGADISASAGYVGTAYIALTETSPNGTLVAARSLEWTLASPITKNGFSYTLSDSQTDATTGLEYVTYQGTSNNGDGLIVKLTFLVSSVAGIVNQNIPIVPKSLESVVTISGYPYASTANSLSLVLGVGTGSASVSGSGRTLTSTGNAVYFSLASNANVGGSLKSVKVSAFANADASASVGNSNFLAQLTGKYSASASFKIVNVTFPAGASTIQYDPSIGTGVSVHESSAATTMASLVLMVSAILLVIL